jgi:hypothetical protein
MKQKFLYFLIIILTVLVVGNFIEKETKSNENEGFYQTIEPTIFQKALPDKMLYTSGYKNNPDITSEYDLSSY